jgi:hypothetical protein
MALDPAAMPAVWGEGVGRGAACLGVGARRGPRRLAPVGARRGPRRLAPEGARRWLATSEVCGPPRASAWRARPQARRRRRPVGQACAPPAASHGRGRGTAPAGQTSRRGARRGLLWRSARAPTWRARRGRPRRLGTASRRRLARVKPQRLLLGAGGWDFGTLAAAAGKAPVGDDGWGRLGLETLAAPI